ncbi:MAG: hypothetical protein E6470_26205, partial [Enterobacteriaceae bacterium]|nr:hypothetical protein [Enterobacteriaceae bacterium]
MRGACRGYQTVARIRRLRRHPGHSPAARRLRGLPERSPNQTFTPPSGTLPGGAALAGLPERSPSQAFTPPSGTLPGGAALAGANRPDPGSGVYAAIRDTPRRRGACRGYQNVARIRRLRRHPGHSP